MANAKACAIVAKAIKTGDLEPVKNHKCVDCGRQATEYDHRDYRKPLEVEPVCRSCNRKRGPALGEHYNTGKHNGVIAFATVTIRIYSELKNQMARQAIKEGISMTSWIRAAITEKLAKTK